MIIRVCGSKQQTYRTKCRIAYCLPYEHTIVPNVLNTFRLTRGQIIIRICALVLFLLPLCILLLMYLLQNKKGTGSPLTFNTEAL